PSPPPRSGGRATRGARRRRRRGAACPRSARPLEVQAEQDPACRWPGRGGGHVTALLLEHASERGQREARPPCQTGPEGLEEALLIAGAEGGVLVEQLGLRPALRGTQDQGEGLSLVEAGGDVEKQLSEHRTEPDAVGADAWQAFRARHLQAHVALAQV